MSSTTSALLPTIYGDFEIHSFSNNDLPYSPDLALVGSGFDAHNLPLVRLHSECLTGDVLGSLRCDCGQQLKMAMEKIAQEGGLLIYLRQEGRGIGLHNKIEAYQKQDHGFDTVEANTELGFQADLRNYEKAIRILKYFNVHRFRLLTNNPVKFNALTDAGLIIEERIPIIASSNAHNELYLNTKREKLGHILPK